MDILRENFFGKGGMSWQDGPHSFPTVHALQEPGPATLNARTASLIDLHRRSEAFIGGFTKVDGGKDAARTEGVCFIHKGEVTLLLRMYPGGQGFKPSAMPGRDDIAPALWIFFDLEHDHHRAVVFHVPLRKRPSARWMWACEGPLVASFTREEEKKEIPGGWSVQSKVLGGVWHVLLTFRLGRFGLRDVKSRPVAGFQIMRMHSDFNHIEESSWRASRVWRPGPTCFGEMVLVPSAVTVQSVDVSDPIHGMNRAAFEIRNLSGRAVSLAGRSSTDAPSLKTTHSAPIVVPARKTVRVQIPYETSIMDWENQVIAFTLTGPGGALLYRCTYRAGSAWSNSFGASFLQLKHRLPHNVPRGQPAPSPKDPDFYPKKRLHILSNMPDIRRDPRDHLGAIIGVVDGKTVVRFDLRKDGAMKQIARHIEGLFDNDDDRIIAALYFVHQACTWCGVFNSVNAFSNPLSMLRTTYVLCGDFVIMLSGLLRCIKEKRTGKPFAAHYTNAHNHIICAIGRGDTHILVDPNLGFFFPNASNKGLATLSELYRNPALVRRVAPGRLYDYNEAPEKWFFSRTMHSFPPGAPAG